MAHPAHPVAAALLNDLKKYVSTLISVYYHQQAFSNRLTGPLQLGGPGGPWPLQLF